MQFAPGGSTVVLVLTINGFHGVANRHAVFTRVSAAGPNQPAFAEHGRASAVVARYAHGACPPARSTHLAASRAQLARVGARLSLLSRLSCLLGFRSLTPRACTRGALPAADAMLAGVPSAQRPHEVAREALGLTLRGSANLGGPGGLLSRPNLLGMPGNNPGRVPNAAQLALHGVPAPPAGENFTVLHVDLPTGPPFAKMWNRFHANVNAAGPIMAGAGFLPSMNHGGHFQFTPAPAAGNQTQAVLAPGGMPVAGAANITSYDTGHGSYTAVRAALHAARKMFVCETDDALQFWYRQWRRTRWLPGPCSAPRARCERWSRTPGPC